MTPTLLIVDDEKTTREGLRAALEDRYDVYLAEGAKAATTLLEQEHFDVLLTDFRLPSEDGMKLIARAKSLSKPDALGRALENPKRPLAAIVAGSKVSTKLTLLNNLAQKVDRLIVGGGIANTFLLAEGFPIGKSLAEPDLVPECKKVLATLAAKGATLPLPIDVVVAKEFSATAPATVRRADDVRPDEMILDIGPSSALALSHILRDAGTIIWNGPVGVFEFDEFAEGTRQMALSIAEATANGAFSIAGGGDTLAAIAKYGITDRISYISTGGGAFLEFLEGKSLPAIEILQTRASAFDPAARAQ